MSRRAALTITTEIEVKFVPGGCSEEEVEYPEIEIEFEATPDEPEVNYQGEILFVGAKLIDGKGLTPTQDQIDDWGREYLDSPQGEQAAIDALNERDEAWTED